MRVIRKVRSERCSKVKLSQSRMGIGAAHG